METLLIRKCLMPPSGYVTYDLHVVNILYVIKNILYVVNKGMLSVVDRFCLACDTRSSHRPVGILGIEHISESSLLGQILATEGMLSVVDRFCLVGDTPHIDLFAFWSCH